MRQIIKTSKNYQIDCAEFVIDFDEMIGCGQVFTLNDGDETGRKDKIDSHVKAGDYFGTLATILDILRQDAKISPKMRKDILNGLRNDLLYLQDNYSIVRNNDNKGKSDRVESCF